MRLNQPLVNANKPRLIRSGKRARSLLAGLVALLTLGSCATTAKKSAGELLADSQTAARVEAALVADPRIFARHIDVSADARCDGPSRPFG